MGGDPTQASRNRCRRARHPCVQGTLWVNLTMCHSTSRALRHDRGKVSFRENFVPPRLVALLPIGKSSLPFPFFVAARYTNGVGTAPRNSRCTFPFTANGRRYDDCITEDLGELNLANVRHPQSQSHVRTPVGEGAGTHIGWGWCSIDHEYVGRWGECYAPSYAPTALNGGDTSATLRPDPHAQYWSPHNFFLRSQGIVSSLKIRRN